MVLNKSLSLRKADGEYRGQRAWHMRLLELLMDRSLQAGTRRPLVILIGISCGTHTWTPGQPPALAEPLFL